MRFIVIATLAILTHIPFATAAEPVSVGFAETDITPPVGYPMAGYYHERLAEGQKDPLKAKAVVFVQGDVSAAFIVADLTGIARDLCEQVRQQASQQTGIAPKHIVVSATHSHTAPDYTGHLYRHLKNVDTEPDSYPAKLMKGCVQAIVNAHENAQPVVIRFGAGQQQTPVAFNRRFVMKDGSVKTWQNFSNPGVVRSAGPIDPEIGLLQVNSPGTEDTLGVISNFALHLDTVGGNRWSGDYPYFIKKKTAERTRHGFGFCVRARLLRRHQSLRPESERAQQNRIHRKCHRDVNSEGVT